MLEWTCRVMIALLVLWLLLSPSSLFHHLL